MGEGRRSACSKAQVGVSGFMLDTGALIAVDRGDRRMLALLEAIRDEGVALSITAPVVAPTLGAVPDEPAGHAADRAADGTLPTPTPTPTPTPSPTPRPALPELPLAGAGAGAAAALLVFGARRRR